MSKINIFGEEVDKVEEKTEINYEELEGKEYEFKPFINNFQVINNLRFKKDSKWLNDLTFEELKSLSAYFIIRYLMSDDRYCDKLKKVDELFFKTDFTNEVSIRIWYNLLNTLIPKGKFGKIPYLKSIKEKESEIDFLLQEIQKYMKIAENDWNNNYKDMVTSYFFNEDEINYDKVVKVSMYFDIKIDKKIIKKSNYKI